MKKILISLFLISLAAPMWGRPSNTIPNEAFEEYVELDISGSGDFDLGQSAAPVIIYKKGRRVTVQFHGNLLHDDSSGPSTDNGFIPDRFQPSSAANMLYVYYFNSATVYAVSIQHDGSINFIYKDWAGSGATKDATSQGFSVSYVLRD